jgi:hypothetical protein
MCHACDCGVMALSFGMSEVRLWASDLWERLSIHDLAYCLKAGAVTSSHEFPVRDVPSSHIDSEHMVQLRVSVSTLFELDQSKVKLSP